MSAIRRLPSGNWRQKYCREIPRNLLDLHPLLGYTRLSLDLLHVRTLGITRTPKDGS